MDDLDRAAWFRLHFKYEDTARLGVLTGLLIVLIVGAYAVSPTVAVLVGIAAAFGGLASLQLHLRREMQMAMTEQQENIQALLHLFTALPAPRAPIAPLTGWAASPQLAVALHTLVMRRQPVTVVELGSGSSTVIMAYALQALGSGRVLSLDHDAAYAEETRADLKRHGLEAYAEVIHAPLVPTTMDDGSTWSWYDVSRLPELDAVQLVVVDGPPVKTQPMARYPALPILRRYLGPGACVVLDDAERPSEQQIVQRWTMEVPQFEAQILRAGRKRLAVLEWQG